MQPAAIEERTALQRLQAGQPYVATDPELRILRQRAHRLTRDFAATGEEQHLTRVRILASLFGELGEEPEVEAPLHVEYGRHIRAGRNLCVGPFCVFVDAGPVIIGDDVRIGPAVHLYAVNRPFNPEHRAAGFEQPASITIGDGVWIGGHSVINPGVTIGAGAVLAPGSIVFEDIPPGVYALGNPCRVVRS